MAKLLGTILVALSDSEPSSTILLEHTRALASRFDSRVVVVQAVEAAARGVAADAGLGTSREEHVVRLNFARFAMQLRQAGVWSPDSIVTNGRLGEAVVHAATVEGADLILIADDRELESPAAVEATTYVLRKAPCAVLVLR